MVNATEAAVFASVSALDSFDLPVRSGEVRTSLGPNGAGNCTTIGMSGGQARRPMGPGLVHRPARPGRVHGLDR